MFFSKNTKINFQITAKTCIFAIPFENKVKIYNNSKKKNKKMTKADIINQISASTGLAKKDVAISVESFMEVIKNSLLNKENVYLRGFGSFVVKHRAEKTARNISKNTTIVIAAHDFPSFKPAKSFVGRMKGEIVEDED